MDGTTAARRSGPVTCTNLDVRHEGVVMSAARGRVRVLGPIDVVGDDEVVRAPRSAIRRTIIALLATRRNEVVTTDWLMEHVWGDEQPDSGVRALRFHVSQLRKECGDAVSIETRSGGYALVSPPDSVDVELFAELARRAHDEPDDERAAELSERGLALWRGEAFVDAAPCPTLDHEARRLDEMRLSLIEHAHARRIAAGAGAELVSDLARLAHDHPVREGLWASLIVAQYRAGRQSEALATYEAVRGRLADELGLDPSPDLQELQLRVLRQDPDLGGVATAGARSVGRTRYDDLPALATSFVEPDGLEEALAVVRGHRLVTLTGAGGVGKTRTAIELGARCRAEYADGVQLVELAPLVDPGSVVDSLATELSVLPQPGETMLESIVEWYRGREMLLIVDNCEHVADAISAVIGEISVQCPGVSILATSREPLRVAGERVHRVAPLGLPAACDLFVQRAVAAERTFVADDGDAIGRLCETLDGIPLAIELAAARVPAMTPGEMLSRLDDRFRLLRVPGRGRPERHQTLRAAVGWSYQLLGDAERRVFERAAVFAGDFDLDAAEVVCADGQIDRLDVFDLLSDLVDKSMVTASYGTSGTRFRLMETLREYALERLVELDGADGPRDRHLAHYLDLAERVDLSCRGPREREAQEWFEREWHNLRTAHGRAVATHDLDRAERLLDVLFRWARLMFRHETVSWIERTLAIEGADRSPRPHTFAQVAWWLNVLGDTASALDRAKAGLDLAPTPSDPGTALCWGLYADIVRQEPFAHRLDDIGGHDPLRQFERTSESLDLERETWVLLCLPDVSSRFVIESDRVRGVGGPNYRRHVARLRTYADRTRSAHLQAHAALFEGHELTWGARLEQAIERYERALGRAREIGDVQATGDSLRAIALAATAIAADRRAAEACRAALEWLYDSRFWARVWQTLESAALVLASLGNVERASTTLGYLEAHRPPFGIEHGLGFRRRSLDLVARDGRSAAWMSEGAARDAAEVVVGAIDALTAD